MHVASAAEKEVVNWARLMVGSEPQTEIFGALPGAPAGNVHAADRSRKTPGREADAPAAVEADAWKRRWMRRESLTLLRPANRSVPKKPVVESRWAITWEGVDGRTPAREGMAARGFEDPDPRGGLAETVGSVSLRPYHPRLFPRAITKWNPPSLESTIAFERAFSSARCISGLSRNGIPDLPNEFGTYGHRRMDLMTPRLSSTRQCCSVLHDAHGFRFKTPASDPRPYFLHRLDGRWAGAMTTRIDDTPRCGDPHVSSRVQQCLGRRPGATQTHGASCVRVGMQLLQDSDFSAEVAKKMFMDELEFLRTSPTTWTGRRRPLSMKKRALVDENWEGCVVWQPYLQRASPAALPNWLQRLAYCKKRISIATTA